MFMNFLVNAYYVHIEKQKFLPSYKPSRFLNANFPPIMSPSKEFFEKYTLQGLFSEFYGNFIWQYKRNQRPPPPPQI